MIVAHVTSRRSSACSSLLAHNRPPQFGPRGLKFAGVRRSPVSSASLAVILAVIAICELGRLAVDRSLCASSVAP